MAIYDASLPVKEGIREYFRIYNLGDGGYDKPIFKIRIWGRIRLVLPNTKGRIEAVKLHDIHHVLNEYPTKMRGEAEIGAWEIGSGCGKYYAAWLLNFGAIIYGIFLWPKTTFEAFVKGRRCLNLYHGTVYNDELLNTPLAVLRKKLGINSSKVKVKRGDVLVYTLWIILSLMVVIFPLVILYLLINLVI